MPSNHTLSLRLSRKEFAYRTGVTFRGLTISQTRTGFNVVIRGLKGDGAPVYSMVKHNDPVTALEILVNALGNKGGAAMWHKDKFYSNGGQS